MIQGNSPINVKTNGQHEPPEQEKENNVTWCK